MTRIFALVSPHLDDAALSCSRLLAANPRSHVVTVFGAGPPSVDPLPEWDLDSPLLQAGDDVTAIRRREDIQACEILAALPHHLGFWDAQYRTVTYGYEGPADEALVGDVAAELIAMLPALGADAWVMPLGLVHPDHELVASACLKAFVAPGAPDDLYFYWDLPYRLRSPDGIEAAEAVVRRAGLGFEPGDLELSDDTELKRRAVECHRSQLVPLGPLVDAAVVGPETFFRLTRT